MKKVQELDPLSPVVAALALTPMLTGRNYNVAIEGGLTPRMLGTGHRVQRAGSMRSTAMRELP
jgi:hypothetical protein